MRIIVGGIALSLLFACTGNIESDDDDGSNDPVTLSFTTPTAGAAYVRDRVEPAFGWRAAEVSVDLAITGAPATVELSAGDLALGTADASGHAALMLTESGTVTLTATAKDAGSAALATATVEVTVGEPTVADCHAWLELYGQAYTAGPVREGVADPVTLTTPINGLPYRYSGNAAVRPTFFMDCSLARSLLEAAPHLRSRGVVEVTDIGVYNYRCIGGVGTPPDCPNGMSQHAYAKGIDLAGFTFGDGSFYSVNDDWVIDPDAERTCEATTDNAVDAWLHEAICALKADKVWNIVLTPNYNADHRNHFHVDLTNGSDYINKAGKNWLPVDEGPDGH